MCLQLREWDTASECRARLALGLCFCVMGPLANLLPWPFFVRFSDMRREEGEFFEGVIFGNSYEVLRVTFLVAGLHMIIVAIFF